MPALVRHTLNLESGLNDGLALPLVLFFLILAEPGGDAASSAVDLLGEVAFGALVGVVIAFVGGRALARLPGGGLSRNYEGVYALGLALAAYGFADATFGNGLIAAFVAGVALGVAEHDVPKAFAHFNESISAVLQVGVFFIFGALIVSTGWDHGVLPLIGFIVFALLIARPVAVLASLAGARLSSPVKLFVAWFGPEGGCLDAVRAAGPAVGGAGRRAGVRDRIVRDRGLDRRARADGDRRRRAGSSRRHRPSAAKGRGRVADRSDQACAGWNRNGSVRRSWRNTNESCCGGLRPSGCAGRKVGQGFLSGRAQSMLQWKKQSSQRGLRDARLLRAGGGCDAALDRCLEDWNDHGGHRATSARRCPDRPEGRFSQIARSICSGFVAVSFARGAEAALLPQNRRERGLSR